MRLTETAELTPVDNKDIRFTKRIELASIPKPGETLTMCAGEGEPFPCEVVQANWHHEKNIFVVACRYGRRSVSPGDYRAIANAADWSSRPLL